MRIVDAQLARAVSELSIEGGFQGRELAAALVWFLRRQRLTRRAGKISRAIETYSETVSGTQRAVASTAYPLDTDARQRISEAAPGLLGRPSGSVAIEFREDPTIIGGLRLETVDMRYDSSVARALRELHKSL